MKNDSIIDDLETVFGEVPENAKDELNSYGGVTLPITKEMRDKAKNLYGSEAYKKQLKREFQESLGLDVEEEERASFKLFEPDQTYYKTKAAKIKKVNHNVPLEYHKLREDLNHNVRSIVSDRALTGFYKSVRSNKSLDVDDQKKLMGIRFVRWCAASNIDVNSIDENTKRNLIERFNKETKIKLPILIPKLTETLVFHWVGYLEHDMNRPDLAAKEMESNYYDRVKRIKAMVRDGHKWLNMEHFVMVKAYFDKYGFDKEDKKYFNPEFRISKDTTMGDILKEFEEISGYRFIDVYKHYALEYKNKHFNETHTEVASPSDKVTVNDNYVEEIIIEE